MSGFEQTSADADPASRGFVAAEAPGETAVSGQSVPGQAGVGAEAFREAVPGQAGVGAAGSGEAAARQAGVRVAGSEQAAPETPVAAALRELETLGERDLAEHPDVYQRIHAELQSALATIDNA